MTPPKIHVSHLIMALSLQLSRTTTSTVEMVEYLHRTLTEEAPGIVSWEGFDLSKGGVHYLTKMGGPYTGSQYKPQKSSNGNCIYILQLKWKVINKTRLSLTPSPYPHSLFPLHFPFPWQTHAISAHKLNPAHKDNAIDPSSSSLHPD